MSSFHVGGFGQIPVVGGKGDEVAARRSSRSRASPPSASPAGRPRPTLMRRVSPVPRSCRNTSHALFVSPGTRLLASDRNATKRPSALTSALALSALPASPRARHADDLERDTAGFVEDAVAVGVAVAQHELSGRGAGREQGRRARAEDEIAAVRAEHGIVAGVVAERAVEGGAGVDERHGPEVHHVHVADAAW